MLNSLGGHDNRRNRLVRGDGHGVVRRADQAEYHRALDADLIVPVQRKRPLEQQRDGRYPPDGRIPVIRASEGQWLKRVRFNEDLPEEKASQQQQQNSNTFHASRGLEQARKREIVAVRKEYAAKLAVLEVWRRSEERQIRDKYEKKAPDSDWILSDKSVIYHIVGRNQFQFDGGDSACSAISMVAIYNFLRCPMRSPKELNWQRIAKLGADLWKRSQGRNGKQQQQQQQQFQGVQEVYNLSVLQQLREAVSVVSEEGGHLDDARVKCYRAPVTGTTTAATGTENETVSFYTLREGINLLFSRARAANANGTQVAAAVAAASFTIRDTTVSLLCTPWTCWLFDSHGGIEESKATLVECRGADALYRYVRRKYPYHPDMDLDSSATCEKQEEEEEEEEQQQQQQQQQQEEEEGNLYADFASERHHDMNTFFMVFFESVSRPPGKSNNGNDVPVMSNTVPLPSARPADLVLHDRVSADS